MHHVHLHHNRSPGSRHPPPNGHHHLKHGPVILVESEGSEEAEQTNEKDKGNPTLERDGVRMFACVCEREWVSEGVVRGSA